MNDNLSNRMYEAAKKWGVNKSCDQKLDFVDGYEAACRDLANHSRADADTAGAMDVLLNVQAHGGGIDAAIELLKARSIAATPASSVADVAGASDCKHEFWGDAFGQRCKHCGAFEADLRVAAGASEREGAEKDAARERMQMRLKVERLAAMLIESEKTKRNLFAADGEVTYVRIGWGAWARLRAAIADVIEAKCEADLNAAILAANGEKK